MLGREEEDALDFFDSHFHLVQYMRKKGIVSLEPGSEAEPDPARKISGCTCALDEDEFIEMEAASVSCGSIFLSFGIHPENPDEKKLPFVEKLLARKRISAVGEIGFDFWNGREGSAAQEKIWSECLDMALQYGVPVIIHNRKALDMMYRYARKLSDLPSVMFHAFPFGLREAESLLSKGINAYFSFGKNLLKGGIRCRECVESLPLERIFLETDAPFQASYGMPLTEVSEIEDVYRKASFLRGMDEKSFAESIASNAQAFFPGICRS
ncbi:MAG: TatD family hydrolase [Treponema sp.]|nr:TatD family hydrolase [Treponema sp.]